MNWIHYLNNCSHLSCFSQFISVSHSPVDVITVTLPDLVNLVIDKKNKKQKKQNISTFSKKNILLFNIFEKFPFRELRLLARTKEMLMTIIKENNHFLCAPKLLKFYRKLMTIMRKNSTPISLSVWLLFKTIFFCYILERVSKLKAVD